VAILAAVAGECLAQAPVPTEIQQNAPLMIETDKAQLVHLTEPARTVFVANPDIADVQVPTPTSFLIYGKKPGTTTAFAISATGVTTSYAVRISRPLADVEAAVQAAVPNSRVSVTAQPNGITISGSVSSPRNAERIKAAAKQFLGDKENINYNVAVSVVR
jgi:pilus assembly protein CpaC